ncbi:MAG: tetratricopeptide repeat protein [Proteobacteria bacterium]|nr:tetratricopeptide repeat protein [Pseudomonadota bacterium]
MLVLSGLLGLAGCQGGSGGRDNAASGTDAQIVDSLILAAQASAASGDWLAAVQYWGSLLQRDPTSETYARGLGEALRRTGNYGDAVQVLRQGVTQNPESEPLLAELGKALLAAGQRDEAIATLNNAAVMNPSDWSVQSALGVANVMAGRPEVADQHYRQAMAITPNNPLVLNNYALHLAINGRLDEGLAIMETAAASPGATTQIRQNLALLLAIKGDMGRAEQIVRGELSREDADRQMAFLHTLSSDDLINLSSIVDESDLIIDSTQLVPPPGSNVVDLTNVGAQDPGFLENQPGVTVIEQEVLVAPVPEEALAPSGLAGAEGIPAALAGEAVEDVSGTTLVEQSAALTASLADALDAAPAQDMPVAAVEPAAAVEPPAAVELPAPPPEPAAVMAMEPVVAPAAEPQAEAPADAAALPAGPAWRVQLASRATPEAAETGRSRALADHAALLAGQPVDIVAAVLDNGATTWRVLAGRYAEKPGAVALCEAVRAEGGDCFVMKDNAGG